MKNNPHFEAVASWNDAESRLAFKPLRPSQVVGVSLQSIAIHVRDFKHRELPVSERSLEAHYTDFVLTQVRCGVDEARRLALEVPYGSAPREAQIVGHAARVYELGPEPEPGDIDPRNPAVVTWHDGEMFLLIASDALPSSALIHIAESVY